MKKQSRTGTLVECGLLVAMATILGFITIYKLPMGGAITLFSMAPLVVASLRHGTRWGLLTAAAHGLIQMIIGFENVLYCTTALAMIGCVLLDYILAFAAMGLAHAIAARFRHYLIGVGAATVITGLIRYACSFLSGILIWGGYAPEGTPVWVYSLTYNGSYMIPEIVITAIAVVVLAKTLGRRFLPQGAQD
jgi:thiamine transporter